MYLFVMAKKRGSYLLTASFLKLSIVIEQVQANHSPPNCLGLHLGC